MAVLLGLRDRRLAARPAAPHDRIGGLMPYLSIGFAMVVGFGALQPTTAFYVQDRFWLETAEAIRQASFATAGFAAGAFIVQAFVIRHLPWPAQRLMAIGLAICVLAVGGSMVTPTPVGLVAAFSAMGAGYGLAQSGLTAAVSMLGGRHRQGQVAGHLQAALAAAWIVGALAGTALYPLAIAAPLFVAAGALALAFVLSQAIG
jgi:hypothetical protein